MKKNLETGALEFPPDEMIDISSHAKETDDYFAECIRQEHLNNRVKELTSAAAASGSGSGGGKKSYPSWYLNCKGELDDLEDEIVEGEEANGLKAAEDEGDSVVAPQLDEKTMLKAQAEKNKETVRTEKLARITRCDTHIYIYILYMV
jgi:hypothetical protein